MDVLSKPSTFTFEAKAALSELSMEAENISETSITNYQSTWRHSQKTKSSSGSRSIEYWTYKYVDNSNRHIETCSLIIA
jgi:hypothetical protein